MTPISEKQARKNVRLQSWINFFSGFVFLMPIITLLYKYTGLGVFEITLIANVATLGMWIFELPTSIFADVRGRKFSLLCAVVCNLCAASMLFFFQQFWGFVLASFFASLYWSFWSGTGQAFLEENLEVLNERKKFGKYISRFMFIEQIAALFCPLIASGTLLLFPELGYKILAGVDVLGAIVLVVLTSQLQEHPKKVSLATEEKKMKQYMSTMTGAFTWLFRTKEARTLLYYRCFANHASYFPLLILILLTDAHMPTSVAGIIQTSATIGMMIILLFTHKIGEKISYNASWILATLLQAVFLIFAAFTLQSWWILAGIYILFTLCDALWQPAWNHVLVEVVHGQSIATTRSLIFSIFALYTTVMKQFLSLFPVQYSLLIVAGIIFVANLVLAGKVAALQKYN